MLVLDDMFGCQFSLENSLRLDQFLHIHEEIATLDVDFCPLWDTDPWIPWLGMKRKRIDFLVDWLVLLVGGLEHEFYFPQ